MSKRRINKTLKKYVETGLKSMWMGQRTESFVTCYRMISPKCLFIHVHFWVLVFVIVVWIALMIVLLKGNACQCVCRHYTCTVITITIRRPVLVKRAIMGKNVVVMSARNAASRVPDTRQTHRDHPQLARLPSRRKYGAMLCAPILCSESQGQHISPDNFSSQPMATLLLSVNSLQSQWESALRPDETMPEQTPSFRPSF